MSPPPSVTQKGQRKVMYLNLPTSLCQSKMDLFVCDHLILSGKKGLILQGSVIIPLSV